MNGKERAVPKQFSPFRVILATVVISLVAMLAGSVMLYLDHNVYRKPPKAMTRSSSVEDVIDRIRKEEAYRAQDDMAWGQRS
jgi:hypothetical protein